MCDGCYPDAEPTKLDPAVKADWVSALRSGEYSQGHGALQKGGGFCCLGVLCDLAVKAGVELTIGNACGCGDDDCSPGVTYNNNESYPPTPVLDWAGMSSMDPIVKYGGETRTLSALNDEGRSFEEIANLIEEQL